MYGAIIGDIAGSRFEFDRGGWKKDFRLFIPADNFTDDTVMTVAVAEALMEAGEFAEVKTIKEKCIAGMQRWAHRYPYAGYGARFIHWLGTENPKPYGSYGNGSAMRVSAAGWLYDSFERTIEVARATAEVSHNHAEGIKGAECTAAVIFMGRQGCSMQEIQDMVTERFCYDTTESLAEMRKRHEHIESCQDSLPKALKSFYESASYEDAIRNAISLGGDTDTIAAICGAMAAAYYGIPKSLKDEANDYLPKEMLKVINAFEDIIADK